MHTEVKNYTVYKYVFIRELYQLNESISSLTLCYRWGGIGALRELVGGDAGHGWRWETPWDQVIKCHQLIGSCLLPPPRPPVAEPNLEGQRWRCLISVCVMYFSDYSLTQSIYDISRHFKKKNSWVGVQCVDDQLHCSVWVTCCVHMDEAHAGPAYTSHMEPVEENLLHPRSGIGKFRLGPWEWGWEVCVCAFVLLCGANRDQQVTFKWPGSV